MSIFWQVLLALIAFFVVLPLVGSIAIWLGTSIFDAIFRVGARLERVSDSKHLRPGRVFLYGMGVIALTFVGLIAKWTIFG